MNKIFLSVSATALLVTGAVSKEIKIGAVLPMTGPLAAYGQNGYDGVELANKMQPKLKNGDTVKVVLVDNKGDKVETATSATRLITKDNVSAIIGAMTSTNTAQVMSIAEKNQIPVIAPAATSDKLTMKKKYANRVCFTDSFQGNVVANYAFKDLGLKTAVVVVDQAQVYSLGLAKVFKKTFVKNGGKILKKISVNSGDKDFKAVVSQIKSVNPDFVFMPLYHPEAAMIARQAKEIQLNKPMLSGDGVANPSFIELGKKAVEGHMYTDTFDYLAPPTKLSKDFIDAYEKAKGKRNVNSFTALGADAYFVLVDAMNRCKNPSDSKCINEQVKSTVKFEGVSGFIDIEKSGDAVRSAVVKEIKDQVPTFKATVKP
ncbi:MAG: ABC transporter substrate-binding protein [Campylobacteraceae bacterium]|nr:ABC transporter substrate-binding protein [Campylobacteraceae bacterium]